jgi:hypothetical protein
LPLIRAYFLAKRLILQAFKFLFERRLFSATCKGWR